MTQLTRTEGKAFIRQQGCWQRSPSPGKLCDGCASDRMARVRRSSITSRRKHVPDNSEQQRLIRPKSTSDGDLQLPSIQEALPYTRGSSSLTVDRRIARPPHVVTNSGQPGSLATTYSRSPEGFTTITSPESSNLGVGSFDSGSPAIFDRNRTISPSELTPTHSISSLDRSTSFEGLPGFFSAGRRGDHFGQPLVDRSVHHDISDAGFAIDTIHDADVNEWTTGRHDPIPLPNMMLPSGLQHVRDLEEPWSPLEVEDIVPTYDMASPEEGFQQTSIRDEGPAASRHQATSQSRPAGRRSGPLSQMSRQNANDVRKERSCLRCFVYKETCDTNKGTCQNCSNKQARTWKLGCVRPRLMFRTSYLLPEILASRLERKYVDSFIQHRGWTCRDKPRFAIPLEIGLGQCLNLPVREFLSIGSLNRPAYLPSEEGKTATPISMFDLPVVISCEKESEAANHIRNSLLKWYHQTIECTHEGDWAEKWFHPSTEPFAASIMKVICEYFRTNISQHRVLREALALSFFNYIFIYSFNVPKESIDHVRRNMETPVPADADYISPSIINLYVKMLMLPPLRDVVKKTLKGLENLLLDQQNGRVWRRDLLFCVGFIVLAYLGRTQVSVLQYANQPVRDSGTRILTHEAAEQQVHEMESELGDLIIKYHEQFMTPSPRRKASSAVAGPTEQLCEEHAQQFNFMEKIRSIVRHHRQNMPASLEPQCGDVGAFIATNTTRICWKFVDQVLSHTVVLKKDPDTDMSM